MSKGIQLLQRIPIAIHIPIAFVRFCVETCLNFGTSNIAYIVFIIFLRIHANVKMMIKLDEKHFVAHHKINNSTKKKLILTIFRSFVKVFRQLKCFISIYEFCIYVY